MQKQVKSDVQNKMFSSSEQKFELGPLVWNWWGHVKHPKPGVPEQNKKKNNFKIQVLLTKKMHVYRKRSNSGPIFGLVPLTIGDSQL